MELGLLLPVGFELGYFLGPPDRMDEGLMLGSPDGLELGYSLCPPDGMELGLTLPVGLNLGY